ncbi:hypothetical protein [Staphylococcus nepalensis]
MEQKLKQAKFNVWAHLMTWPMLLVAILAGPVILYSNLLGVVVEISLIALSMIAAFKVDSLKKSYQIQTYDRVVAFMKGNDPNEVHSSKLRNTLTFIYSFVLYVGSFIIIMLLSIYIVGLLY